MFTVNFTLPWLWFFSRDYHVDTPDWESACRIADMIEKQGFPCVIVRS